MIKLKKNENNKHEEQEFIKQRADGARAFAIGSDRRGDAPKARRFRSSVSDRGTSWGT